jgi:hypothetical protein
MPRWWGFGELGVDIGRRGKGGAGRVRWGEEVWRICEALAEIAEAKMTEFLFGKVIYWGEGEDQQTSIKQSFEHEAGTPKRRCVESICERNNISHLEVCFIDLIGNMYKE